MSRAAQVYKEVPEPIEGEKKFERIVAPFVALRARNLRDANEMIAACNASLPKNPAPTSNDLNDSPLGRVEDHLLDFGITVEYWS